MWQYDLVKQTFATLRWSGQGLTNNYRYILFRSNTITLAELNKLRVPAHNSLITEIRQRTL